MVMQEAFIRISQRRLVGGQVQVYKYSAAVIVAFHNAVRGRMSACITADFTLELPFIVGRKAMDAQDPIGYTVIMRVTYFHHSST